MQEGKIMTAPCKLDKKAYIWTVSGSKMEPTSLLRNSQKKVRHNGNGRRGCEKQETIGANGGS